MNDDLANIKHTRVLGYCSRGVREFFNRHNLDYSKFIKEGLPCDELLATNDSMAIKVVEVARGRR